MPRIPISWAAVAVAFIALAVSVQVFGEVDAAQTDQRFRVPLPDELAPLPTGISVTGTLTQGPECLSLQADDGRVFSLVIGNRAGVKLGDHVQVDGRRADASICMQGPTIIVAHIKHRARQETSASRAWFDGAIV
jgi:hypothetical protein